MKALQQEISENELTHALSIVKSMIMYGKNELDIHYFLTSAGFSEPTVRKATLDAIEQIADLGTSFKGIPTDLGKKI